MMTSAPIEKELTIEAFAAHLLAKSNGEITPLWLCTNEEAKQELISKLDKAFNEWVQEELNYKTKREKESAFKQEGVASVIELKDGESPTDYL